MFSGLGSGPMIDPGSVIVVSVGLPDIIPGGLGNTKQDRAHELGIDWVV